MTVGLFQIDPFGHSREQAALFAQVHTRSRVFPLTSVLTLIYQLGFDGLFLGRIDYQDKLKRQTDKTMEMIWEGSSSVGNAGDIFTGILPNVYSAPSTFCFDLLCADPPIMVMYCARRALTPRVV